MKQKTIYELISLYKIDEQAKNKLDEVIETYVKRIKKSNREPLSSALKDMLLSALEKMMNGDG